MGKFTTTNRTSSAVIVADNLYKTRSHKIIDQTTKTLIDKLLLEKIPASGIARVTGVSEPWLQSYVNGKYEAVPRQVEVSAKKRGA